MATYAFANGKDAVAGFGDRWKVAFSGAWAVGDYWSVNVVSTSGDMTLGVGNLHALTETCCFTYKNRVYLGMGSQFNFSDNGDPTGWEQQNPGAGFVKYLSQFGSQDTVSAFTQLQGRLAVLGRRSVQMWTVDADPNNFALVQTLDNTGTRFPLSVQNVGDFDALYVDDTGVRSLRVMEVTLNAQVDDIGSAVDSLIKTAVATSSSNICAIVDPATKTYWVHINGTIYVLSKFPSGKIQAWSTFEPRGSDNALFTPAKFVVYNGQVFVRSTTPIGGTASHFVYGGANNTTYDAYSQVTFQVPWLDDKRPDTIKSFTSLGVIASGKWQISFSSNPQDATPFASTVVWNGGTAATPNALTDSTYDVGRVPCQTIGTHFSLQAVSQSTSTTTPVIFSAFSVHYNIGNTE